MQRVEYTLNRALHALVHRLRPQGDRENDRPENGESGERHAHAARRDPRARSRRLGTDFLSRLDIGLACDLNGLRIRHRLRARNMRGVP
ncbi:hypothetical protein K8P10_002590 [Leucobacter sp. Psy1]|nr:hypothetical protein K8P10_002590 [Leucobacter sp. Psy1]